MKPDRDAYPTHTHTHTNIACNVTRLFFFFASTMVDRMPGPILSFYSFSFMYFRSQSFRLVVPFVSDVLLFSRSFLARSDKLSRFMQSSILRLKKIEVKKKKNGQNATTKSQELATFKCSLLANGYNPAQFKKLKVLHN